MAILAVVVSMSSCGGGSSFEGDVKKFGNMRCKAQQLAATFGDEMSKKYEKDKDNKEMEAKADKIMKDIMDKCK